MDWFSKIFDIHKIPFKIMIGFSVVSAVLNFFPEVVFRKESNIETLEKYELYIGIIFLVTTTISLIYFVEWISKKVKTSINTKRAKLKLKEVIGRIEESVASLDHAEKAVLREFHLYGQHNINLPIDDPVVTGLINKRIIYISGRFYQDNILVGRLMSCSISKEAEKYLTFELLGFPSGEPTRENMTPIMNKRPSFAKELDRQKNIFR